MNPMYQQYLKGFGAQSTQATSIPPQYRELFSALQNAKAMAASIRDPRQYVLQSFPGIPTEIRNDPDQIIKYLQQTLKPEEVGLLQAIQSLVR